MSDSSCPHCAARALAARQKLTREWLFVLDVLIENTKERIAVTGDRFYSGKLSALEYLHTLASEDMGLNVPAMPSEKPVAESDAPPTTIGACSAPQGKEQGHV